MRIPKRYLTLALCVLACLVINMLAVASILFLPKAPAAAFWFLRPVLWLTAAVATLTHFSFDSGPENFVFGVLVGSVVNIAVCTGILLLLVKLCVHFRPKPTQ